ncbi:MAG: L,D-transpeptidase family protein [Planctomycetes bacterium]|nr:L,D-transpeptidase family protein [Planctomycetota bacterium]
MIARRVLILLPVLALGGCATFDDFLSSLSREKAPEGVPLAERPVEEPLDPNRFELTTPDQSVVGEPQVVFASNTDTLSDLARAYGLGYDEIVAANPGIDPWLPGEGTPIVLPTQYVLPDVQHSGLILNIATRRLFYYPEAGADGPQYVLTYPIGIGRVGWETPLGRTTVVSKARDPHWWVPASVRQEHAEAGNPLPSVVPPGPDNPLGNRVLKLDMPGYLIHGTNQPYGVGMRVSHGCVRLYPENIESLYELVDVGEVVTIVNEPFQFGYRDGELLFEAHAPLEDDALPAEERLVAALDELVDAHGVPLNPHLKDHVKAIAANPSGVPVAVAYYDAMEFMARARVVRNTVEEDPNAPTLSEVREMMEEVEAEIAAEQETL